MLLRVTANFLWQTLQVHVAFDANFVKKFPVTERDDDDMLDVGTETTNTTALLPRGNHFNNPNCFCNGRTKGILIYVSEISEKTHSKKAT